MKNEMLITLLLSAVGVLAGEPEPKIESLPDLIAEALRNNPAVAAARARWEAARERVPQSKAWEDPMWMASGSVFSSKGMNPREEGNFSYGVSQTVPFFGKRRLAGAVAEKEAARAYEEYQEAAQEVVMELRKTHTALLLNQKMIEVNAELRGWMETAEKSAAAKVAANQAMQSDLLRTQTELALLDKELIALRAMHTDRIATMNRLLARKHDAPFGVAAISETLPLPYGDVDALTEYSLSRRPALRALAAERERAKAALDLARREQRAPDFTLGTELRHYHGDGELREAMFTVSVPLPWWNDLKYRARVREEQANYHRAQAEWENLRARTEEEIHHLLSRLNVATRTAKLYEDIILPREKACCIADLAAYEAGQLELARLLDSYRQLKKSELERYEAVATALRAQAELEAILGTPLAATPEAETGDRP